MLPLFPHPEFTYLPAYACSRKSPGGARVRQKVCLTQEREECVCVGGVGGGGVCSGRWRVEGRVEDTRHSCIPIDTEEGFLLQPRRDGREGASRRQRALGGGGRSIGFQPRRVSMCMRCACWWSRTGAFSSGRDFRAVSGVSRTQSFLGGVSSVWRQLRSQIRALKAFHAFEI